VRPAFGFTELRSILDSETRVSGKEGRSKISKQRPPREAVHYSAFATFSGYYDKVTDTETLLKEF